MIDPLKLTIEDKGRIVEYRTEELTEQGVIVGWTDRYIFVDYAGGSRNVATEPRLLHFVA